MAIWTLVRFCSPVVIVCGIVVLDVPVVWLVTRIIILLVSVKRLVIWRVIWLIPVVRLVTLIVVVILVHIVPVVVLGVLVRQVVIRCVIIFAPPVVPLVHQSVSFVLTVVFMVLQQTCHSLDGFDLSLSPGPLYCILVVITQLYY